MLNAMLRLLGNAFRPNYLVFGLLALAGSMATASPLDFDPASLAWSRLTFRPAERPGDLQVEISLSEATSNELSALPGSDPGDELAASGGEAWHMTSIFDVFYTGRTYRTDLWFSSEGPSPVQRHRDKLGRDANRKAYRFLADGVGRLRIEPDGSAEAEQAADQWSFIKEDFFPYGAARDGCSVLSDPSLLFLAVSSGVATRGNDPLTLCVFNKKTIYRVKLSAGPVEALAVEYVETRNGARSDVRRKAAIRKVTIEAFAPDSDGVEPEAFEFFEMSGDIEIELDAENGLPLRISGDIAGLGRIAVRLNEVDLRP